MSLSEITKTDLTQAIFPSIKRSSYHSFVPYAQIGSDIHALVTTELQLRLGKSVTDTSRRRQKLQDHMANAHQYSFWRTPIRDTRVQSTDEIIQPYVDGFLNWAHPNKVETEVTIRFPIVNEKGYKLGLYSHRLDVTTIGFGKTYTADFKTGHPLDERRIHFEWALMALCRQVVTDKTSFRLFNFFDQKTYETRTPFGQITIPDQRRNFYALIYCENVYSSENDPAAEKHNLQSWQREINRHLVLYFENGHTIS